jgi:hypothetical protein
VLRTNRTRQRSHGSEFNHKGLVGRPEGSELVQTFAQAMEDRRTCTPSLVDSVLTRADEVIRSLCGPIGAFLGSKLINCGTQRRRATSKPWLKRA